MALAGEDAVAPYSTTVPVMVTSATFTAETVVLTVTASLVAGTDYAVKARCLTQSSVADDRVRARIREDSLTGAVIDLQDVPLGGGNSPVRVYAEAEYTAPVTGSKTFVVTLVRQAGTGNIQLTADATYPSRLAVMEIL
jgi:hypothetical protein